jgi:lipid A 4'-phosphatase
VGIGVGALVGLGRLLQGGHFLGDVVFAFWATYFSCVLVAWWLNLPPREASVEEPPA